MWQGKGDRSKNTKQFDNVNLLNSSIKRKDQIKALNPAIQIDKHKLYFNPSVLFTRLSDILQTEEDIKPFFANTNTNCIV